MAQPDPKKKPSTVREWNDKRKADIQKDIDDSKKPIPAKTSKQEQEEGDKVKDDITNTPANKIGKKDSSNHSNMHENIHPSNTIHQVAPVQKGK